MPNKLNLLGALSATALLASLSCANATVVGTFNSNNCNPFCFTESTPYQQVYGSGAFSAPITISSITLYGSFINNSGVWIINGNPFELSLSTTSAAVDGLSSNPASNLGSDNLVVFSGKLPTMSGTAMTFILSTAFTYDPTLGNLLLTVTSPGPNSVTGNLPFDADASTTDQMSRLYMNGGGRTDSLGLVTGFNEAPTPTPLPAALPMFAAGAALVGVMVRRRKQRGC
jgi:hypothetical protein